ncbi:MAG: hypothetical protein NTU47_09580 [Ignavibacteriales bacterium]|nr:hypothetical protein [Ignavibacteriales bacterium]
MNTRPFLLFALIALQFGCSRQQKDLTPADEKLVPVYAELLMLNEELKSPRPTIDSTAYQSQVHAVLSTNGLTREEFSSRMIALAQSQEVFSQFQTKVHAELERRKSKQSK